LATAAALPACSGGSSTTGATSSLTAAASSSPSAPMAPRARHSGGASPSAQSAPATTATRTALTLITGDRVQLVRLPDGSSQVAVEPGPGRSGISFAQSIGTRDGRREVTVLPADAVPLVAAGRLDARLFNVTELLRQGFGDERETTLPLIVTYAGRAAIRPMAQSSTTRTLPSINGQATVVDKQRAGAFWNTLTAGSATRGMAAMAATGVSKVWLDGRAQLLLDQSAPQIGAPTAWGLGITGKGVTVALLDTGIQLDHPDFAGRIAVTKDFTGTRPDAGDDVGHGTHCAGIIGGSGAASHGKYKGVAPDVTLIDGKVCQAEGCPESAIIAGMEWAAPAARIVSMSLGSILPSDGTDPLSQAVNSLTTKYGTLFVIAAGNRGTAQSIGSPGAADLALTVGSVTKQDTMSDFSSRGPRIGDYAIKPEIAAPGSDIVSARAKGTRLGDEDPVDDFYTRMSGTSMATPHVAGAAALLAQLHPDWKAAELKAALISSSKRLDGAGVADDGAGRVDVARAVTQRVFATVGTVSFGGGYSWPHNQPVATKTVSYRNDGDAAVTLSLTIAAAGPDGKAAPAGLLAVAPSSLTVPAHGTADASVTLTPSAAATVGGVFGGVVSASDGSNVVDVAIDVFEEPESYNLTVHRIGRAAAAAPPFAQVYNVATGDTRSVGQFDADGNATVRLQRGVYDVNGVEIGVPPAGDGTIASEPSLDLSADRTVTWDFRSGQPVSAVVDRASAVTVAHGIGLTVGSGAKSSSLAIAGGNPMVPAQPVPKYYAVPTSKTVTDHPYVFAYRAVLTAPTTTPTAPDDEPYLYNLAFFDAAQIPAQLAHRVHDGELAAVHATYYAQGASSAGQAFDFPDDPRGSVPIFAFIPTAFPSRRLELYSADGQIRWHHQRTSTTGFGGDVILTAQPELYQPGLQFVAWNRAPLQPTIIGGNGARRFANVLSATLSPFSPSEENHVAGLAFIEGTTTLSRDGQPIAPLDAGAGFGAFKVPPDDGLYTLTMTAARGSEHSIGTQTSASWTFHSQAPPPRQQATMPLLTVRAAGLVDLHGVAPAGALYPLGLTVEREQGAPASPVAELQLDVSYDDGQSWQPAPTLVLGDHALALLQHPGAAGFVSLRTRARDEAGNTATQTMIHAYAIAPLTP
jgi:subtilisin family serine protease